MSASAVVNADQGRVAIWHVATEPIAQTSRLCGAWVTDDSEVQRKVVTARAVVVFGDELTQPVKPLLQHAAGTIDIKATLAAIEQHIFVVNGVHAESRTDKGNPRAPIPWPVLPAMLDWAQLPPVSNGVVNDPLIRSTIAVARWIADLADIWSAIETTRTARAHLCRESPTPLPLPLVLRSAARIQS